MERIHEHYRNADVEVMTVIPEVTDEDSRKRLSNFHQEFKASYTALDDPENSFVTLYGLQADLRVPTVLIIDKPGIVCYMGTSTPWFQMADEIERLRGRKELSFPSAESVVQALKEPDSYIRWKAAEALMDMADETATPALIEALSDESDGVREFAAKALGKIVSEDALEPLTEALDDESNLVRLEVVKSLENMKDERTISPLVRALADSELRRTAAEALAEIDQPELVSKALESSDILNQGDAVEASYAYSSLGFAYQGRRMYNAAISVFLKATELCPDYYHLRTNLVYCYFKTGEAEKAISELLKVLENASPSIGRSKMFWGDGTVEPLSERENCLRRFYGEVARTFEILEAKLSESPQSVVLYETLGNFYYQNRGMYQDAISMYEKAIELSPDSRKNYYHLALAYSRAGVTNKAVAIATGIAEKAPEDAPTRSVIAKVYLNCKMYDDAIATYKKAMELAPDDRERSQYQLGLANSCELVGRHSEAVAEYEDIISNAPDSYEQERACEQLAKACEARGEDEKAVKVYLILVRNSPTSINGWARRDDGTIEPSSTREGRIHRLVELFQNRDKLKELTGILESELAESPEDDVLYETLGRIYDRQEINQKAIAMYEKAQKIDPSNIKIWFRLASVFSRAGMTKQAIAAAKEIAEMESEDAPFQSLVAKIYLDCKMHDDALKVFQKAIALTQAKDGWDKVIYQFGLANCYAGAGRYAEAYAEYENIIQNCPDTYWRDKAKEKLSEIYSKGGCAEYLERDIV